MQGVFPGQAAVSCDACRHSVEIPGDVQLSRQDGCRAGPGFDHARQPGRRGARDQPFHPRQRQAHGHHENRGPEAGARQARF